MQKSTFPEIRIISVDHDRTTLAAQRLRHALTQAGLHDIPTRNVFCHLEAGRCGVKAGYVALEVDGCIVWGGKELTESLAGQFCESLTNYMRKQGA